MSLAEINAGRALLAAAQSTSTEPRPLIGGEVVRGIDVYNWTGGKPNETWDDTENAGPETPMCYRSSDPKTQTQSYFARTGGADKKFERANKEYPLISFEKDVQEHFIRFGLDSEFYVPDQETGERLSIITAHSLFPDSFKLEWLEHMRNGTFPYPNDTLMTLGFDSFNLENMEDAKAYIFGCIDEDLKTSL